MSENKKLIWMSMLPYITKSNERFQNLRSEQSTKLRKKEIRYLLILDVLLFILKRRFLILGLMDIFVLMVFILLLMAKPSIIRSFQNQLLRRSNRFVKPIISMEHLRGKNVLISVIIMLIFIHTMVL
jgi:hypothetical protein